MARNLTSAPGARSEMRKKVCASVATACDAVTTASSAPWLIQMSVARGGFGEVGEGSPSLEGFLGPGLNRLFGLAWRRCSASLTGSGCRFRERERGRREPTGMSMLR